jgi:hypothetical protein
MSRERVKQDAARLNRPGSAVRCVDVGETVVVVLEPYSPPANEAYAPQTLEALAFIVPATYPDASPDPTGFYVKPTSLVAVATNGQPQSTSVAQLLDSPWLKFSWSPKGPQWDGAKDTLETHLATLEKRFLRKT